MPTYGYECAKCKDQFEVIQRITEDALAVHEDCGGELRRLLYPVGIVFKGPGFHVNDYGKNGKSPSSSSTADKGDLKPESKTEAKSEAKTETKSEPKADAVSAPAKDD